MTVHKVIHMGHPTLRQVAQKVPLEDIGTQDFKELLLDMHETMKFEGGIGIAAPQINISKQVALIEIPENNERYGALKETPLLVVINPEITILDEDLQGFWEGCLSVPGLRGFVERPKKIRVDYLNEKGEKTQMIVEDFLATVFQHELDHLFGKLYVDQMKDMTKLSYVEEFNQFIQARGEDSLDE